MKLSAIRSASKKFLVTRETMSVFPSMAAFARLLQATIELHRSIDPDDQELPWTRIAIGLLRLVLTVVGDVTLFWKKWLRF
jgi:hypothetical protein